jgi:hypothetical protein
MSKQYEKSWTTYCELIDEDVDLYLSSLGDQETVEGNGMRPGPRSCSGKGRPGCPVAGGHCLSDWDPCPLLRVDTLVHR